MRIGELVQRTGISARSIRHYDENGLLQVDRTGNGYRVFDESAPQRVLRIKQLIDYGLTIEDIRPLAECLHEPASEERFCDHVVELYENKLRALDEEIEHLRSRRRRLAERVRYLRSARDTETGAGE